MQTDGKNSIEDILSHVKLNSQHTVSLIKGVQQYTTSAMSPIWRSLSVWSVRCSSPWFWTVLSIILHCIFTHSSVWKLNTNYLALKYATWDIPRVFLLKIRSQSQRVWWASSLRPVLTWYHWWWWVHDYVCIYICVDICLQLGLYCVRPNSVVLPQSYINICKNCFNAV